MQCTGLIFACQHLFFQPKCNNIPLYVQIQLHLMKTHGKKIHLHLLPASCQVLPIHLSSDPVLYNEVHKGESPRYHLCLLLHNRCTIHHLHNEFPEPRYEYSVDLLRVLPKVFSLLLRPVPLLYRLSVTPLCHKPEQMR